MYNEAYAVALDGKYAYIADGPSGLQVLDISDPSDPKLVASFNTPGESAGIFTYEEYLIVPDSFSLLVLKD